MSTPVVEIGSDGRRNLQATRNYDGNEDLLDRLRELIEADDGDSEAVMSLALEMQGNQNEQDLAWARELGVKEPVFHEIFSRLVARGGLWLLFVQTLARYSGELGRLQGKNRL